ncbi:hypothetical protein [Enterococcus sp. 3C7_DIV0644]|uniref:hypothetical protein n=1 Tax=Enterococcus sp. 3C7_DIV0644 TaxID=1834174 RepID=UPI000A33E70F|nr:hypothetical protein [Enterococcus sp. 3C7_DIV0644]OTO24932.1 hypothetical protein A5877_000439 [Enterococcus sp. 3C7_DIV0644]
MAKGAFQTSREIFENPIWTDVVKFRIFFYIYGNAVYAKEGTDIAGIHLNRGQFLRSYRNLQNDLAYMEKRAFKTYSISTIKDKIDQLVKEKRIKIEVTDYGTLFTVLNYEEYQGFERYSKSLSEQQPNSNRTLSEQQPNNNKKEKKEKKDKNNNNSPRNKRKKRVYADDDPNKILAKTLFKLIKKNHNIKDPNLDEWANTIRLTIESDKRTGKEVQDVIVWAMQDDFWYKVVLSPSSLRRNFDQMVAQMNSKSLSSKKTLREETLPEWAKEPTDYGNKKTEVTEEDLRRFLADAGDEEGF